MENFDSTFKNFKNLIFFIFFVSLFSTHLAQQFTIVDGNSTNQDVPIDPYYDFTICQSIYEMDLLIANGASPGQITHLSWEYYKGASNHDEEISIYMGNTGQMDYPSSSSWIDVRALTLVYQGPVQFTATGWTQIPLQTPFNWDGQIYVFIPMQL